MTSLNEFTVALRDFFQGLVPVSSGETNDTVLLYDALGLPFSESDLPDEASKSHKVNETVAYIADLLPSEGGILSGLYLPRSNSRLSFWYELILEKVGISAVGVSDPTFFKVLADAKNRFRNSQLVDASSPALGATFYSTTASPSDWYSQQSKDWQSFIYARNSFLGTESSLPSSLGSITDGFGMNFRKDMNTAVANEEPDVRDIKTPSSSFNNIEFEYCVVTFQRQWWSEILLTYPGFSIEGYTPGQLSAGTLTGPMGPITLITSGVIVVRNLRINADWSSDDRNMLGIADSIGPFSISESNFDEASGELRRLGMQAVAWICSVPPAIPPIEIATNSQTQLSEKEISSDALLKQLANFNIGYSQDEQLVAGWIDNEFTSYRPIATSIVRVVAGRRVRSKVDLLVIVSNYERTPGIRPPRAVNEVDESILKTSMISAYFDVTGTRVKTFDEILAGT